MRTYRARVIIYFAHNMWTMAWAIYNPVTGGVVLTDNFGAKHFWKPSTWELIARELDAANRMAIAGHELESIWGHVDRGPWS